MDLSKMSDPEIMMLPDNAFGKRWVIGVADILTDGNAQYAISKATLPERTVFWYYRLHVVGDNIAYIHTSIRFGHHLPTTDAEFYDLEHVFPDANRLAQSDFVHYASAYNSFQMPMRDIKPTAGRRIVMRTLRAGAEGSYVAMANFEISSVPKSLPEWFH